MTPQSPSPDKTKISELAHQFWLDEGKPDGCAIEHWKRAEAILAPGAITELEQPQTPASTGQVQ